MLTKILKSLGLSDKEARVYLSTLRTGTSRISGIAKRSEISRSTAYNTLNSLFEKGLVRRFNQANIQYYSPLPPNEIIDLLEKRKEEMNNKIEMIKAYVPQLESICVPDLILPKVTFYEGIEGIKQIYNNILKNSNKKTFVALSMDNMAPELKEWTIKVFTKRKIKKKISSKVLISSKNPKSYVKLDKKHLRESLVIPHKKYPFEVEIDVYDENKTAFISFDETEMMGVIIESPKIANTLKSLFSLAWDSRTKRKKK